MVMTQILDADHIKTFALFMKSTLEHIYLI